MECDIEKRPSLTFKCTLVSWQRRSGDHSEKLETSLGEISGGILACGMHPMRPRKQEVRVGTKLRSSIASVSERSPCRFSRRCPYVRREFNFDPSQRSVSDPKAERYKFISHVSLFSPGFHGNKRAMKGSPLAAESQSALMKMLREVYRTHPCAHVRA